MCLESCPEEKGPILPCLPPITCPEDQPHLLPILHQVLPSFLQNMNLPLTAAPGPGATTLPRATVSSPGPTLLLDMEARDIL